MLSNFPFIVYRLSDRLFEILLLFEDQVFSLVSFFVLYTLSFMIMTINSTEIRKLEHLQQQVYKNLLGREHRFDDYIDHSIYFRSEITSIL